MAVILIFLFSGKKPVEKETGKALVVSWEKMSKSKFNGVEPDSVWNEHGIDTTRLLILADVSPRSSRHWSSDSIRLVIFVSISILETEGQSFYYSLSRNFEMAESLVVACDEFYPATDQL